MPATGKLLALEGIDGSGKLTQMELLARALELRRLPFRRLSFPRYDAFFGHLVAAYLNGEFGGLDQVDPHFSALLFAGDRLETKPLIESELAAGKMILADRYIGSNLAHQGARVPKEKREEFLAWLKKLEYEIYALPPEDLAIYLRVAPREAHRRVAEKGARQYTSLRRDLQESSLAHLEAAAAVYDRLAAQPNWVTVSCADSSGAPRSPEEIQREILRAVESRLAISCVTS